MDAATKLAVQVARRCICLELLFQRERLEADTEDPIGDREEARRAWASRLGDGGLEVDAVLLPEERAFVERPVGGLSEDELDDVHGRAVGALVLLWALGRIEARPPSAEADELEAALASSGLLGDGAISRARAAAEAARLRPAAELDEARRAYLRARGKAREVEDPSRIFAGIAAHHLTWVLDPEMRFDEDIALG